ncbi:TRAF interacting protein no poles [Halictus rubicundus]|uniref:TRAF interacting protein no poles n=1 Tax=Halictus rubicundus TaxID=77578 RepID=UPI004036CC45
MNIVCVICSDLLTPSADVFHTPCGHIFHHACLSQWLQRSKSCPQCREKTTLHKIHRIYFNFSNNDTIIEDTCSLQEKVDKLSLELSLKEKDAKHFSEKCNALENETMNLKKELLKIDMEKGSMIGALKLQLNYFKEQALETDSMKKENEQLKERIETFKNIQTLLEASTEEIDNMVSRTCDSNTLVTYISVMKREMTISLNKRRELRSKVKSLQQALTKATMEKKFLSEEHTKRKKLEEDYMICESEKMALQNKLSDLEKKMRLLKQTGIDFNVENNLDNNAENVSKQNAAKGTITNKTIGLEDIKDKKKTVAADIVNMEKNDSPYLPVRSGGLFVLKEVPIKKRGIMKTSSSVLTKRPRTEKTSVHSITYDGFGGHSKYDQFPSSSDTKIKKNEDDHHEHKV